MRSLWRLMTAPSTNDVNRCIRPWLPGPPLALMNLWRLPIRAYLALAMAHLGVEGGAGHRNSPNYLLRSSCTHITYTHNLAGIRHCNQIAAICGPIRPRDALLSGRQEAAEARVRFLCERRSLRANWWCGVLGAPRIAETAWGLDAANHRAPGMR